MKKKGHVHKYRRIKLGKRIAWKCMDSDCPHYIYDDLVMGRLARCNKCGEGTFIMDADKMRRVAPKCDACQSELGQKLKGTKKEPTPTAVLELNIDDLLDNL